MLNNLIGEYKTDQICRQVFFAWLFRHAKWRRFAGVGKKRRMAWL